MIALDHLGRPIPPSEPDAVGRCSQCRRNATANYDPTRERDDPWNELLTDCCGARLLKDAP